MHQGRRSTWRAAVALLGCLLLWSCAGASPTGSPASTSSTSPATTVPATAAPAAAITTSTITTSTTTASTTTTAPPAPVESGVPADPVSIELVVVETLPHDPRAFTQGLVLGDGVFYESTGLYGESTVRIVDPATGRVIRSRSLEEGFFGEGLELVGDRLIQLTWREETAFVWDAETLAPLGTYSYAGEGWGLCAQEDRLVMSDGSSWLTFRDRTTFEPVGGVEVLRAGVPVQRINELECVEDLVYANVWQTEEIVVIDPGTGRVVGHIDASSLRDCLGSTDGIDVLNGIAYDPEDRSFYLTGKLWPEIFQVRLSWN
ncbi:MAG: glutaminyl-peptide cyclotransferase [bacterium]|nr:glutaminyl-peptide cyclotransferase [bacterium]